MRSRDKRSPGDDSAGAERPARRARAEAEAQAGAAEHVAQLYRRIYAVVRRVPRGCVVTYGQVAELAGMPGAARVVGAAMRANVPALGLPWQRVVGKRARGIAQVSIHDPVGASIQRAMLEQEGVVFSASGGISLAEHGWLGDEPPPRSRSRPESKVGESKVRRKATPARPRARKR